MSVRHFSALISVLTGFTLLSACATTQENPNYKYSTKYKDSSPHHMVTPDTQTYHSGQTINAGAPIVMVRDVDEAGNLISAYHTPSSSSSSYISSGAVTNQPVYTDAVTQTGVYREADTFISSEPITGGITYQSVKVPTTASYTRVSVDCINGESVANNDCQPVQVAISQQQPVIIQAYNGVQTHDAPSTLFANNAPAATTQTQSVRQTVAITSAEASPIAPTDQLDADTIGTPGGTPGYYAMLAANAEQQVDFEASQQSTVLAQRADLQGQAQTVATLDAPFTAPNLPAGYGLHEIIEGNTVYSLSRSLCVDVSEIQQLNGLNETFAIRLGDTIKLPKSRC